MSRPRLSFDRKDYPAAEQQFRELLRLIDDPDMGGRLGDLRMLVDGLCRPQRGCGAAAGAGAEARAQARRGGAGCAGARSGPTRSKIYTSDDEGVDPVHADPPGRAARADSRSRMQTRDRGILDVTIDEQGRVISATIRLGLHPIYDSQILLAAKEWRYQPATLNGRPVKFRKIIQITVSKR